MNTKFKWAIGFLIVGILFTAGGALMRILNYPYANRMLVSGLIAHIGGFGLVVSDLYYQKKVA